MALPTIVLTVNSVAVNNNTIVGAISITHRENEASLMEVTLQPAAGLQDLDSWAGKSITLDVGGVRSYTGVVDMPEVDVIYKRITLVCTDKRRERLNDDLAATIGTIGFYSDAVFPEVENVIEELDQRLQTIPSAADYKPDGTYALTDINPKTIPDITLTDSDIYRRQPQVNTTSRARLTNQVNLTFDFQYTRKRHREREFKIQDLSFCDILDLGALGSFTLKKTFLNYADQMDWIVNESTIVWEEMPASTASTAPPCTVDIAYIHDDRFATSMTYDAATRFSQTVTERFTITVKAPQSITQYGLIDWDQANGLKVEFDSSNWESFKKYQAPTGGTSDANDYYIDEAGLTADFDDAILTAINIANTKIIRSHRDAQATFETDLRTDFDLTKTIELSTVPLDAKGKVTEIFHLIDISLGKGNTTTTISLSTATGTQTPDSLTVPTRPSVPVLADAFTEPQVMLISDGNVVTPAIDDTSRDEQIVTSNVTYNVEIQNDTFGVTF